MRKLSDGERARALEYMTDKRGTGTLLRNLFLFISLVPVFMVVMALYNGESFSELKLEIVKTIVFVLIAWLCAWFLTFKTSDAMMCAALRECKEEAVYGRLVKVGKPGEDVSIETESGCVKMRVMGDVSRAPVGTPVVIVSFDKLSPFVILADR